jgi:hypothetical protein
MPAPFTSSPSTHGLTVTGALASAPTRPRTKDKNFVTALMHQQCWCWGKDVQANENVLLRFGFTRHRAPTADGGQQVLPTRYELHTPTLHLALWGFGLFVSIPNQPQAFISRHRRGLFLLARRLDISSVHSDGDLLSHTLRPTSPAQRTAAARITAAVATWCESYERWIAQHLSPAYRQSTLQHWEHPIVTAADMPAAWHRAKSIYKSWYQPVHHSSGVSHAPLPTSSVHAAFSRHVHPFSLRHR